MADQPSPVPCCADDDGIAALPRAIVIAMDAVRSAFVVENEEGICAVFCQYAGPVVRVGDILSGAVTARGSRVLTHPAGQCAVVGDSGPLTRDEALALVGAQQHPGSD